MSTWSILDTGRWLWKYASLRDYRVMRDMGKKPKPLKDPRKVISVDYREHELRVAALLAEEGKDASMVSQLVIPDPPER